MMSEATMSWTALLTLGAFHGINPGMGWLFAVALGLQERRRAAVWRALLPLALGHALAVAAALVAAAALGLVMPAASLRWPVAGLLVALGVSRLFRHRHPRWAAMRVGMGGLTLWSFLMASAHGAGLMVVPVVVGHAMTSGSAAHHHHHAMSVSTPASALAATAVHAAAYLLVTAILAVLVFEKLGVGVVRKAWVNLDLIWAGALIVTGVVSVLV